MRYGLKEEQMENINSIFSKYTQIEKAVLYGSRAKGNYKKGSDVDVTLFGDGLSLTVLNKICLDIDDLLLPYTFDISIYKQINNPDLRDHIKRVGVVFFDKKQSHEAGGAAG
ncbi:MAG: nucleotidyltransferase domain-containing protein [Candidatus Margulisiibacteriota bacterium]